MPLFNGLLDHGVVASASALFGNLCRDTQDGLALVMVGLKPAGQSVAFNRIYEPSQSDRKGTPAALMPVIRDQLESVGEGRVNTKWLCLHLLKVLKQPSHVQTGDLDRLEHVTRSQEAGKKSQRTAVTAAMEARQTSLAVLDEAHLRTAST